MRKRNIKLTIRISKEEKEELETLSRKSGYTQAGYLISLYRGKRPKFIPNIEYHELINQLRRIGTNLNQIALKANSLNVIDNENYYKAVKELREVIAEVKKQMQLPEDM